MGLLGRIGNEPMAAPAQGGMPAPTPMPMPAGAAAPAPAMGMQQLVMAFAREIKQKAPDTADEAVIGQAQQMAMAAKANPGAREQIERIVGKINWDG